MNLPNKITLSRIFMTIIIIFLCLFPFYVININMPQYNVGGVIVDLRYIISGVIFIIASLTDLFDGKIARKNNLITDSVKYQLFSTIDYWEKSKKYICKYKIKENNKTNKWYRFWCNSEGKEVGTYKDDFTSPCMLFYEKI